MWQPGVDNVFTRGLIMSFQADHALTPNGDVGAALWTALIGALASDTVNTGGYNYGPPGMNVGHSLGTDVRSCGRTCSIGPTVSMMRARAALAE
jgi:peptidoglycan hydrolase-like protein with peptidoglycan-binding domain